MIRTKVDENVADTGLYQSVSPCLVPVTGPGILTSHSASKKANDAVYNLYSVNTFLAAQVVHARLPDRSHLDQCSSSGFLFRCCSRVDQLARCVAPGLQACHNQTLFTSWSTGLVYVYKSSSTQTSKQSLPSFRDVGSQRGSKPFLFIRWNISTAFANGKRDRFMMVHPDLGLER